MTENRAIPRRPGFAWLLGWATPAAWFSPWAMATFPRARHTFFSPTADGVKDLCGALREHDILVGFSLGAFLLLRDPQAFAKIPTVVVLAPVFGLVAEQGVGGKIPARHWAAWRDAFAREPGAAMRRFHTWAGLDIDSSLDAAEHDERDEHDEQRDLLWGLRQLQEPLTLRLPPGWRGWVGAQDPLIDGELVTKACGQRLSLVTSAGHHPGALIEAMAATSAGEVPADGG